VQLKVTQLAGQLSITVLNGLSKKAIQPPNFDSVVSKLMILASLTVAVAEKAADQHVIAAIAVTTNPNLFISLSIL
jgi:hypothetical protein|tara:strand:+ start:478 stop:705 length:228 start_codon:yes stop_codon:yes gene_type:complete